MSKGRYRVRDCQGVDWSQLGERACAGGVIVAVDVAKEDFVAAVVRASGELLERIKWRHPEQTRLVLDGLVALQAHGELVVVMESSGSYGDALRWQLQVRGIDVYRVSSKQVHDSAEVYDGVASLHDAKAADLIALLHRHGRSRPWPQLDEQRRSLSAQVQRLEQLKGHQQRQRNRLEALLSRHWPELPGLIDRNSVTLAALVAAIGSPLYLCAFDHRGAAVIRSASHGKLDALRIDAILDSARTTLGVPCLSEENAQLRALGNDLLATHQAIHQLTQALQAQVAEDDALQPMSEVIGAVGSAVLHTHLGAPSAYPSAQSYLKAMGLNLREYSSGKHQGRLRITKRGAPQVRYYLYFAALRLIAQQPGVARWFRAKSQRPGACKGKHVVELMRRLAKGLWHQGQGEVFAIDKLVSAPPPCGG
ncbi:MAG: IS110 family transposase [Anaerolineae bacterium]